MPYASCILVEGSWLQYVEYSIWAKGNQANYINAWAVSVSPFFEPAMSMTLGGLFVTLGGFRYDIG
jgi:hypothetical protein